MEKHLNHNNHYLIDLPRNHLTRRDWNFQLTDKNSYCLDENLGEKSAKAHLTQNIQFLLLFTGSGEKHFILDYAAQYGPLIKDLIAKLLYDWVKQWLLY